MDLRTKDKEAVAIFDSIMKASKSFIYRCENDDDVTMTYLSGSVYEITGCSERQLLNNHERNYASLCHPNDLRPMIDAVDVAIEARQSWDIDYRLVRPDSSVILVRERGEAVFDEEKNVAYLQGLVIDASAEYALRTKIEDTAAQTKLANKEILEIADKIVASVRELTMLSINARIEAARAGGMGLGFDVIAKAINSLAQTNARWAEEIAVRTSK